MKLVAVLLASLLAVASSLTAVEEFSAGNAKFTADLYNEVLKKFPTENFIFSPLSVEIILALTRAGAKGTTETEMASTLHLPNQQRTEEALSQLLRGYKSDTDVLKLLSANRLFLGEKFTVLDEFKKIAEGIYDASTENVDFSKSQQAANTINQWVEQQTNNKIKNLIDPGSVDALTRLVLVNALYFSGKWENPFDKYLTHKDKFYTSKTSTKEVDMMRVEDSFRYYECTKRNAKYLELPYQAKNISMTIVLPNEKDGLSSLENNLLDVLSVPNYTWERVAVSLPRFQIDTSLPLKEMLQNLGMKQIFSDSADLSGISNERLKVDDVIQKAFINVTESGTEAAAATAVWASRSAKLFPDPPKIFQADHPFIYAINFNNVIMFSGKVAV